MDEDIRLTLPDLFGESVRKHGKRAALAFVGEKPKTYNEINGEITSLMAYLESMGVKAGDRVALLSANMPNWGITYLAVTFMGAVVVPLLPDFHPNEIRHILDHS